MIAEYLQYCEQVDRVDGKLSKKFSIFVQALRPIAKLFGDKIGAKLEPTNLIRVQAEIVRRGRPDSFLG